MERCRAEDVPCRGEIALRFMAAQKPEPDGQRTIAERQDVPKQRCSFREPVVGKQ